MEYQVSQIVTDVQTCIDEIGLNDTEFLGSSDNQEMNTIITSKIPDALRFVNLHADVGYLEPTEQTATIASDNAGVVSYEMPDDFLRLCYAKLDDWLFEVTDPILYTEKEYASLKNPITTGYPDNPKVAITGDKTIEFYSSSIKSGNVTMTLGYVGETKETGGAYDIPEKLYRAVVYYVAGLVLLTYKDAHADSLLNQAITIMGAKVN